ncbi:hypothetical protein ABMA28_012627 [Loxostege sticticalis]|uniref:Lipase domain-containing protein n=1 Tax=Loxostege sticticalis TaxID=481309 RepID=A0ABD0S4F7_LOXSC
MAKASIAFLLIGLTAVLAFPQPESRRPSWWPENRPWPPQHPEWIKHPEWIQHPDWINWPPQRPSWWPEDRPWPPQHPEWIKHPEWIQHPDWINWPPQGHPEWIQHPDWINWPPQRPSWWPENAPWPFVDGDARAPSWWPEDRPWPPQHPEWIQHPESIQWPPQKPSWWPESIPWPFVAEATDPVQTSESRLEHPEWITWPPQHPGWIPWPPAGWFPEDAPAWWPENWAWPPPHPEWIWPPSNWFPEERPSWWPESWEWPPQHPEAIEWPPTWEHPEWIPWPPQHPEWIPWPPANWFPEEAPSWWPESLEWPPAHPDWIPWPPSHPESIPWPPTHPEWIPWPPANWFPEERPSWWPENWSWPPNHPDFIPTNPDDLPYLASRDNRFHLFTRRNPGISQPIIYENNNLLAMSNYDATKRTVVLIHDLRGSATDQFNAILVPAFLSALDCNVILVDWSGGAHSNAISTFYTVQSGRFVSKFIDWLRQASNGDYANFHLVGLGFGAWKAGFISRVVNGDVKYVTALDPFQGFDITRYFPPLNAKENVYTEVIHTNVREGGYRRALGDVNFYPNGGRNMPGCGTNGECSRLRAVFYFAESIMSPYGFTARKCEGVKEALDGNCHGEALRMGGLEPKTGKSGIFYLRTNANPPFSQQ